MFYNFRTHPESLIPLIPSLIKEISRFFSNPKAIVIGVDSNPANLLVKKHIVNNLKSVEILDIGIVSTPCLSDFCFHKKIPGIQITASHLCNEYTGLKIFTKEGKPLSVQDENRIESRLKPGISTVNPNCLMPKESRNCKYEANLVEIRETINHRITWIFLTGTKSYFPFSHNDDIYIESEESDPEKRELSPKIFDINEYVVSIDGDGDKCIIYKNGYRLIESKILCCLAKSLNCITLITNFEFPSILSDYLKQNSLSIRYVPVGDQFIIELMNRNDKTTIGGEANGHYILPGYTCSDAILSALYFIEYNESYFILPKTNYIKVVYNYSSYNSLDADYNNLLLENHTKICDSSILIKSRSKIYVRKSGWENAIVAIFEGNDSMQIFGEYSKKLKGKPNRFVRYVEN